MTDTSNETEARVEQLLEQMTTQEKALLTGGADVWHLPPVERLGIGRLKMSDGPSGVRGERYGAKRSLSFPCGMAVGATWDVNLVGRYGGVLATEAQAKGVHLLLGPTICIPRTPLAGRTFESFAEDPVLTAELTVAYINGVQSEGVGCCVKHFAVNDQEHERMTISAEVDERTLREVHLPAFEAAVRRAGTWSIMSAYNRLHGTYCGEHPWLLGEVLKGEWGFDGVVVSDWFGTHSTVEAAVAGLDVEMPGPPAFLGSKLVDAVESGAVDGVVLDDHARRILRLAVRTGAIDTPPDTVEMQHPEDAAGRALARELAVGGTVLLANNGILPLAPDVTRIALIGPAARHLATGGGGSSQVTPYRTPSLVDAVAQRFPNANVVCEPGCLVAAGDTLPVIDRHLLVGDVEIELGAGDDEPGSGGVDRVLVGQYLAMGDPAPGVPITDFNGRAHVTFRADTTGPWRLGLTATGPARLFLDGIEVIDNTEFERGETFYGMGSLQRTAEVHLEEGKEYSLTITFRARKIPLAGFEIGAARPQQADLLGRAVAAAVEADVAIVVVGSNANLESEGQDRPHLHLPGEQDALVEAIAAANPRTVVVLNAGSPVATDWRDQVAGLLTLWYPGEEGAGALTDVLAGDADPGGRLPITFPARLDDTPTHAGRNDGQWYPGVDGKVVYGEGLLIGHRHYDAHGIEPAFAFGHGLSYTTFEVGAPTAVADGYRVNLEVPVTNTGGRAGSTVVQVYVHHHDNPHERTVDRPPNVLKAFAKLHLDTGATETVRLMLDERSFAHWDVTTNAWTVQPGMVDLLVGLSSRDIRQRVPVLLG